MKLFDVRADGASEIVKAVGMIADTITFDVWEPVIPLAMRDVAAIIGREALQSLAKFYENGPTEDSELDRAVELLQQAVALFAWLKIIPTLDAQHDTTGRSRRLGENEKGLTALQEFKDEENILHLAYESVDALIECMELNRFEFWITSPRYRQRSGLLVNSKELFDEFYHIGSHRLFVTLTPILREVQATEVSPVMGSALMSELLEGSERTEPMREPASRALVLLTMKKAVERLPVEVIPEGVVQIQQSQPIKSRLRAEQSARQAVAASLGADARRMLDLLQAMVAELTGPQPAESANSFIGPISHSKGMTF